MNMQGGFYWGTKNEYANGNSDTNSEIITLLENQDVEITPFKEGVYGYILLITFNDEYLKLLTDDIRCFRDYYHTPCKRILLKLCYIDQNIQDNLYEPPLTLSSGNTKKAVCLQSFHNEVAIQIDVFNNTCSEFKPITPKIYGHATLQPNDLHFELLWNCMEGEAKMIIEDITSMIAVPSILIGVIYMEIRDDYTPLSDLVSTTTDIYDNSRGMFYEKFSGMLVDVLYRLHNECNIIHCDLHIGNVLVLYERSEYYPRYHGNILLIDWGKAKPYTPVQVLNHAQAQETDIEFNAAIARYAGFNLTQQQAQGLNKTPGTVIVSYADLTLTLEQAKGLEQTYGWLCNWSQRPEISLWANTFKNDRMAPALAPIYHRNAYNVGGKSLKLNKQKKHKKSKNLSLIHI